MQCKTLHLNFEEEICSNDVVNCPTHLTIGTLKKIPKNTPRKFAINVEVMFHDFLHARFALVRKFYRK